GFALTMLNYAIDEVTNPRLGVGRDALPPVPVERTGTPSGPLEAAVLAEPPIITPGPEPLPLDATPPPVVEPGTTADAPAPGALLSVRGLTVRYRGREKPALDGV